VSKVGTPDKEASETNPLEQNDPDDPIFDEKTVQAAVLEWQRTGSVEAWHKVAEGSIRLIDTIIRMHGFQQYDEVESLRNECIVKLHKLLSSYDPRRGRCFTHFSISIKNYLISYAQKLNNRSKRLCFPGDEAFNEIEGKAFVPHEEVSDDLRQIINSMQTRFSDPVEIEAQQFLLDYFLREGFDTSRAELAYTVEVTFYLSRKRAQLLYDYTLISLRSAMFDQYSPSYSYQDVLRVTQKHSLLSELLDLVGPETFMRMATLFGGMSVTFPTVKQIRDLRAQHNLLEQAKVDASSTNLHVKGKSVVRRAQGNSDYERLGTALLKGEHESKPLYAESHAKSC
jgi:hypothetical protein